MSAAAHRFRFYLLLLGLVSNITLHGFSNRTNNDPYPLFTAQYPYTFLTTNHRNYMRGWEANWEQERFCFSVSPFRQAATCGRNIDSNRAALGDLKGRWNMLALFNPFDGDGNENNAVQQALFDVLGFSQTELTTPCTSGGPTLYAMLSTPSHRAPNEQFGFFSVPIKYRKWGVRFETEFYLGYDIGLKIETGVCDIIQTASFVDQTCNALGRCCVTSCSDSTQCNIDQFGCSCKQIVIQQIMDQYDLIAETLDLNVRNYNKRCAEDTRFALYWRRIFPINQDREGWPYFLMMPFVEFEAIAPTGNIVNPSCLFALPGGNNGHTGLGFGAGLNFDFVETIEIGVQASMTEWLSRRYCNYPVPTNNFQQGLFPYKADLTLKPAANWTFAALMNAYHFLDRLSVWAQWVATYHGRDSFCDIELHPFVVHEQNQPYPSSPPGQPLPEVEVSKMECESRWSSHMVNVGLTYDISPNIALGFLWQTPVAQRNAYRSTTLMGSLIVTW